MTSREHNLLESLGRASYDTLVGTPPTQETTVIDLIEYAPALAVLTVVIGALSYTVALLLAAFGSARQDTVSGRLRTWVVSAPAQNLGIPCATMAAFSIVAILLRAFPASTNENGLLSFRAFGLEFSGPSEPVIVGLLTVL
jgi:hypothetical protein